MANLFEATLGGVAFSSIADELILTDIVEEPVQMDTQTSPLALRYGLLRTRNVRLSLAVRLVFVIRTQNVARRAAVRDLVAVWGRNGGMLTVNTRPGKMLQVVMDTPPAQQSAMKWTEELTMTLMAYAWPYWQSEPAPSISGDTAWSDTDAAYVLNEALTVGGDVEAACTVRVQAQGALEQLRVTVGETYFELTGLGIPAGGALAIGYDDRGLLHATPVGIDGDTESRLPCRTAASSDDLLASPGVATIRVVSDTAATVTVTAKEMWL